MATTTEVDKVRVSAEAIKDPGFPNRARTLLCSPSDARSQGKKSLIETYRTP